MKIEEYFIDQLKAPKSDVSKDDILNFASECGLDLKPKMAKAKIIDTIVEHGHYDKLFEYFQEFITIPFWQVADFYKITSQEVKNLKTIGVIKEDPIEKEFYSRSDHDYFYADTYPLSVLNYNAAELKKAYENAFGGEMYSLRIETKTKEQVSELINILEKIFKIETAPQTYEHRNDRGQYSYFKVKPLNNTQEEENKFLAEISKLKKEKEKIKNEYQERIENLFNTLETYLGNGLNGVNLESRLNKLVNGEVNKLNNIPVKNARNAGRKSKFDKNKITEMEIMKENGYSYNQIAKEYSTTKATVIKYLKHKL